MDILKAWGDVAAVRGVARWQIEDARDRFIDHGEFHFANARNYAHALAVAAGCDAVIWLDADDVVVGSELLRPIADREASLGIDQVDLTYRYVAAGAAPIPPLPKYRLFLNLPRNPLRWIGRCHEYAVRDTPPQIARYPEELPVDADAAETVRFLVEHHSHAGVASVIRNERILRVMYDHDGPAERARAAYYLAAVHAMRGDLEIADALLKEAEAGIAPEWLPQVAVARTDLDDVMSRAAQDPTVVATMRAAWESIAGAGRNSSGIA